MRPDLIAVQSWEQWAAWYIRLIACLILSHFCDVWTLYMLFPQKLSVCAFVLQIIIYINSCCISLRFLDAYEAWIFFSFNLRKQDRRQVLWAHILLRFCGRYQTWMSIDRNISSFCEGFTQNIVAGSFIIPWDLIYTHFIVWVTIFPKCPIWCDDQHQLEKWTTNRVTDELMLSRQIRTCYW